MIALIQDCKALKNEVQLIGGRQSKIDSKNEKVEEQLKIFLCLCLFFFLHFNSCET